MKSRLQAWTWLVLPSGVRPQLDILTRSIQLDRMGRNQFTRPPYTPEEARAFAAVGVIRKRELARERAEATAREIAGLKRQLAEALARIPINDDARRQETLNQIDATDKMINAALDEGDREAFLELTDAKQKLWKLALATPGAAKASRRAAPAPFGGRAPTPQAPPA